MNHINDENEKVISGGISGAITDPMSDEAVEHAYKRYGMIRSSHTDIDNIVKNTGFTKSQIILIKNYLFMDFHELENGYKRFDPDFAIGESWWRLAFCPNEIQEHDITLLRHELYEMNLITQGYSQQEAHEKTERDGYNYQVESDEYYGIKRSITNNPVNSGAVYRERTEIDENYQDQEEWDIEL